LKFKLKKDYNGNIESDGYFIYDQYSKERIANFNGSPTWWWLRSIGCNDYSAANVGRGGSIGSILTPVYRLMFDLALKEALGRNKPLGNVYLICDEFKLLPHLRHIDDGVNFGRSLGVKVFAGVQSIEQLYEIYGQSRGRNIAAGFSSVYAFRSNDTATREFVSGLFGKNIVLEQYQMSNNQLVEEKRSGQTVEDWDLNSLKVGEAIVGLPFSPPFRFYFDKY